MGTNFYWQRDVCKCCDRPRETYHIGKSSGGWTFALQVLSKWEGPDEKPIPSLADWHEWWLEANSRIVDECDEVVSIEEMLKIIKDRKPWERDTGKPPYGYGSLAQMLDENHAIMRPDGLLMRRLDANHCIGHGEDGTYDLVIGDFS